jgi:hypothetical protein
MIRDHGGHASFLTIPVVIDALCSDAYSYRSGLPSLPSIPDFWSYIIDPAYLICDKWHSGSKCDEDAPPVYPISFKHLFPAGYVYFDGGDPDNAKAYVIERMENLNADLRILTTATANDPANGATINSANKVKRIAMSRPIANPSLALNAFQLTGGGVASDPTPIVPTSVNNDDTGADKNLTENCIGLTYPAGGLTDSTPVDTVILTLGSAVTDTDSTPIASPNNTMSYIAKTTLGVTSSKPDGAYTASEIIDIDVSFSEIVNVTGTPRLELQLNTAPAKVYATYLSGSGSDTLAFRYTVAAGHHSADLDYVESGSLTLGEGTIKNVAGEDVDLTLPAIGSSGSLGVNKELVIDTTAPVIIDVRFELT